MALLGVKLVLPRFRVRTLLILVAVVALLLEGGQVGFRCYHYSNRFLMATNATLSYNRAAAHLAERAKWLEREAARSSEPRAKARRDEAASCRRESQRFRSMGEWASGLADKYDKARRTPWEVAPADPPYHSSETKVGQIDW